MVEFDNIATVFNIATNMDKLGRALTGALPKHMVDMKHNVVVDVKSFPAVVGMAEYQKHVALWDSGVAAYLDNHFIDDLIANLVDDDEDETLDYIPCDHCAIVDIAVENSDEFATGCVFFVRKFRKEEFLGNVVVVLGFEESEGKFTKQHFIRAIGTGYGVEVTEIEEGRSIYYTSITDTALEKYESFALLYNLMLYGSSNGNRSKIYRQVKEVFPKETIATINNVDEDIFPSFDVLGYSFDTLAEAIGQVTGQTTLEVLDEIYDEGKASEEYEETVAVYVAGPGENTPSVNEIIMESMGFNFNKEPYNKQKLLNDVVTYYNEVGLDYQPSTVTLGNIDVNTDFHDWLTILVIPFLNVYLHEFDFDNASYDDVVEKFTTYVEDFKDSVNNYNKTKAMTEA